MIDDQIEMGPVDYVIVDFPAGHTNFREEIARERRGRGVARARAGHRGDPRGP